MDLFYVLLVLLVLTRTFGEVAERFNQPALVGELIAGIALGAVVARFPGDFPKLADLAQNSVFAAISDLGMFFLMLFAGVEMQAQKILRRSTGSLLVALGGMLVPLTLGILLGMAFIPVSPLRPAQCLFLGTALAITAVPATVRILADLGQLNTPVGETIVSAAVFDDILSLMLLAWLTGVIGSEEPLGIVDFAILSGKVVLFFAVTAVVGLVGFPWSGRLMHRFKVHEMEMSAVLISGFAFAVLAELLSLHFIVGAFIAGLFFGKKTIDSASYDRAQEAISAITFGFLAPIFFASIGLNIDFTSVAEAPFFLILLIVCAFVGKIVGAGSGARIFGFSPRDAVAIGVGMSPRGAVELVIAGIALKAGLFASGSGIVAHIFSAVIIMSVITTVVSPIILAHIFRKGQNRS